MNSIAATGNLLKQVNKINLLTCFNRFLVPGPEFIRGSLLDGFGRGLDLEAADGFAVEVVGGDLVEGEGMGDGEAVPGAKFFINLPPASQIEIAYTKVGLVGDI
jgi:hypothetical protein